MKPYKAAARLAQPRVSALELVKAGIMSAADALEAEKQDMRERAAAQAALNKATERVLIPALTKRANGMTRPHVVDVAPVKREGQRTSTRRLATTKAAGRQDDSGGESDPPPALAGADRLERHLQDPSPGGR